MVTVQSLQRMQAKRGPHYLVHGADRRNEPIARYADTLDEAERIAERMRTDGLRQVQVLPPREQITLDDVSRYGDAYSRAQDAAEGAKATLRAAVHRAVESGASESEIAREAGITRMTVRAWIGK